MTDQPPTLTAEQLLARLQRTQADVDEAQATYDAANVKSRKASDIAGRAYRALDSAQERRARSGGTRRTATWSPHCQLRRRSLSPARSTR